MKEISLEERIAKIEGTVNYLRTELDEIMFNTYQQAVKDQDEDLAAEVLRKIRNKKLRETDKEFTLDKLNLDFSNATNFIQSLQNLTNNEWGKYRQELRDIPQQEGFPFNIIIPKNPIEIKENDIEQNFNTTSFTMKERL